ncbi:Mitochondrial intermembrane space import and assembly protein 40 AltName: Full=Mitochondrial import inner membrane translocase TIM40 [Rhizoctonia solani AG-1 IB]|uniref:Mitochondrial intermembrane space import and assembly protein 40 n=1 Tax=Thanatephorus cucumeris (strain AG1-IB / isolate 7/3/14) TaxID=1108050 RepID=M5BVV7_THACB|nr:Mitochondrial intermembrane space import and assembly protein 40 AltName: Full=Mitochondrial import inner membrane translocase TIM40 [Rhizoctonia solani AG-1 IB]
MPKAKIVKQDDAEFDELEESEDEYDYQEDEDRGFYIKAALKPPNSHPVSCYDLYNQIQEVEADYQRDVVWNDTKQSNLIDIIPPVLFAKRIGEDGEEVKICIDGKQRLTSIHRFMDGYIPLKVDGKSWFYQTRGNKSGKRLIPDGWKKQFASKQLIVVEFVDLSDATERDIFQRVQLGMALNEAEKQKAISSPTVTWIRSLVTKYFEGDDGIPQFMKMNMRRSKDFQCVAQFVYMSSALPSFDSPGAAKLSKFLSQQEERSDAFKKPVERAIKDLQKLVHDETNLKLTGSSAVAPIELVHICLVCLMLKGRSLRTMAGAIGKMRAVIRSQHLDVRANSRVAKSFAEHFETFQAPGVPGPEADWQVDTSDARANRKRKADDDDADMSPTSESDLPGANGGRGKGKAKPRASAGAVGTYVSYKSGGDTKSTLGEKYTEVRRPPPAKSVPEPASKPSPQKSQENTSVESQASVKSSPSEPGIIEPSEDKPAPKKEGDAGSEGGMDDLEADAASQGAFNPETGEINWDCPCLGGMAHGPCGPQFREAFSCFVHSEEDPKGVDCVEKFKAMQDCFREHPDVYGEELEDDDEASDAAKEPKSEEGTSGNSSEGEVKKPKAIVADDAPAPPNPAPESRTRAPTANVAPGETPTKSSVKH